LASLEKQTIGWYHQTISTLHLLKFARI